MTNDTNPTNNVMSIFINIYNKKYYDLNYSIDFAQFPKFNKLINLLKRSF